MKRKYQLLQAGIISYANQVIQEKCPTIHAQLDEETPDKMSLKLWKDGVEVSTIKIVVNPKDHSYTILSDTPSTRDRNKKYNSVLRSIVVLLARSMSIHTIYSDAINWKTVRALLQRRYQVVEVGLKDPPYYRRVNQEINDIVRNTQKLRQFMPGDDYDERKPWLSVRMRLDLSTIQTQSVRSALSHATTSMVC